VIPPGNSIEDEIARYEVELRNLHREALASESTRAEAEKQIAASLAAKEVELVARSQNLGGLPVLW
jgi:hypothetical protein